MAKIVADQLVEMLVEAGVKRVYAVTGDSLNFFNEAIRKDGRLKWIHVRHEEVGAYAAAAEAELDGIACCAGSCGPGHVHLINGMYDAHRSHVPMIVIASTINTSEMGMGYFQETNTVKLFDDCSCYNQLITTAEQAPRIIQTAIQHAIGQKGVAVIGLPGDVSEMKAEDSSVSTQLFYVNPVIRPSDSELDALAKVINASKCVTVFCGIGASGAHPEIVQLSQKILAPVGYSFRGKMGIQHDNPYEIGMTGLLGQAAAYQSMHESDLILLLGTDFPYDKFMPTNNKIIQIDTAVERLGRRAKLEMGLCGDIKHTLQALLPLLEQKEDASFLEAQLKIYEKVKDNMHSFMQEKGGEDTIQPEYLAHCIDELATDSAIFTVDTGMTCVWGARFISGTGKRQMLGSFNHGSMANAMPMAIGAALSHPEQQVIALCGDGGLSMLLGDLATINQYQLPVKIIVFNNRALGMVKLEMEVAGLPDNETNMINPDFAAIAEAMGFKGMNVHKPEEVRNAVEFALSHPGPILLNVFTNPNALAMPPKVDFDQMVGMAKSMSKLMLGGKMQEVLDTIKSNYKHLKEL
ncbi:MULTISPECIES: thiamine pyrophosphate-dependent enzyme [Sphingobacterium]|uniref:thiamine pyrophosphate-dependent enzyme n=1 Tax=Sphingobacterium TaxID=28453 RepID=UPI0010537139|nr:MULTISPECIES: thiamine pyrophosphate-dependent enzyme [Sphingobacterium]MCS3557022.1 pyruvate dehydrogenase (quinone) [Sphingobacterium sp. JUb21]MCW2260379.1 pyruvate dehydrogenase (quinone) [Sphingobacterium kitahiroshimense]TCQ98065.1 pyruvate dehydrogenase (quinone) [Sphingobacterium sp. JUb20]TCR05451.1 pyruvate dehydrogenase (quinone) [Sphingobacterium sp. JUb78]